MKFSASRVTLPAVAAWVTGNPVESGLRSAGGDSIASGRSMLRPDQWFPRHGSIDVTVGPALEPEDGT
ncbi:MAG TPA: hypothetical protein VEK07_15435 [Polyangiaceae bacterium]|nr:hypothetical protein [Polyangiaceae bacterium]